MHKRLWTILLLSGLFLLPAWAAERQEFTASMDKDGLQRVEVVGGSYFFKPNYIILKVNIPVEMKISKDSGVTPHNFIIHAPEAGMDIKVDLSTDPQVIKFTPGKPGKYPFYCDKKFLFLESHKEKGMEGIIEVRE
jgi:plastocyanin domain-containing protein